MLDLSISSGSRWGDAAKADATSSSGGARSAEACIISTCLGGLEAHMPSGCLTQVTVWSYIGDTHVLYSKPSLYRARIDAFCNFRSHVSKPPSGQMWKPTSMGSRCMMGWATEKKRGHRGL